MDKYTAPQVAALLCMWVMFMVALLGFRAAATAIGLLIVMFAIIAGVVYFAMWLLTHFGYWDD